MCSYFSFLLYTDNFYFLDQCYQHFLYLISLLKEATLALL